jgi:hypothetical protein
VCPLQLFAEIHTAQAIEDQFTAIMMWAYATEHLDMPGRAEWWRMVTQALVQRADMIGTPLPMPVDTRELNRA